MTVQEWRCFIEGGGYDAKAPWWQDAGQRVEEWLESHGGSACRPWHWDNPSFNNPLQSVIGISVHEALAYAEWANLLDQARQEGRADAGLQGQRVAVPTEVEWEAGVLGPDPYSDGHKADWAWGPVDHALGVLAYNHDGYLDQTAPAGSCSLGSTAEGLFDSAGNCWEWCANALSKEQKSGGWHQARWQQEAGVPALRTDLESWRGLRGGAFDVESRQCRSCHRDRRHPGDRYGVIGMRLVRLWPLHSEP